MIGVLSDTHSLLRPQALEALRGSTHILHAGDIGNFDFLAALRKIAPVTAIRGNIDIHGDAAQLPATEAIEFSGKLIYMLHSLADLDLKPEAAGIAVVISGHSHKPSVESRNGVLYLNPGSCGPRRFNLPVTVAHLYLRGPRRAPGSPANLFAGVEARSLGQLDATPRAEIIELLV